MARAAIGLSSLLPSSARPTSPLTPNIGGDDLHRILHDHLDESEVDSAVFADHHADLSHNYTGAYSYLPDQLSALSTIRGNGRRFINACVMNAALSDSYSQFILDRTRD